VLILASPDIEGPLTSFESDSILNLTSEHHGGAVHEVVDHVFKFRFKGHWVNQVDVDLLVCCYLDSFVALDEVDETSDVQGLVALPAFFESEWVRFLLEEEDLTGRTRDQSLFVDKIHLTEIFVNDLFEHVIVFTLVFLGRNFFDGESEGLALTEEGVDLVFLGAVEAFVWEVLGIALHRYGLVAADYLGFIVVNESMGHAGG